MPIIIKIAVLIVGALFAGSSVTFVVQRLQEEPLNTPIGVEVAAPTPSLAIPTKEQIEKQEISSYLHSIAPEIEEFVGFNNRLTDLARDVQNRSVFSMAMEAQEIADGFAATAGRLSAILPPDKVLKTHRKLIRGIDRHGVATRFIINAIEEGWNESTRAVYLSLMQEKLNEGRLDTQSALKELGDLEKEAKN